MTKSERIQYLEDEIEDLKSRLRALETKPEPFNPWTPIGPSPGVRYTCFTCGLYITSGMGHLCYPSTGWWANTGGHAG